MNTTLSILSKIARGKGIAGSELAGARYRMATETGFNVFEFPAKMILVDLLSDSGTGPLSKRQLDLLMAGNGSKNRAYGSRASFSELEETMQDIFSLYEKEGFCFLPFPQGRAAEAVFFACLKDALDARGELYGMRVIVPSNSHFDTTRANVELCGFEAHDLPAQGPLEQGIFGGNINTALLKELFLKYRQTGFGGYDDSPHTIEVPAAFMTVTNNTRGGLPVSMQNIREMALLCKEYDVPFFFDAARFAENAYFIKRHEPGCADKTIPEIVCEMFSYCDGFLISFKKDGLSHTGGGLVIKRDSLLLKRFPHFVDALQTRLIITSSNDKQGAIPGGYQLAIAEGLRTAVTEEYLSARVSQVAKFGQMFKDAGIPVLEPFGGHAVYLDADRFFADTGLRRKDFGGIALTALLLLYGIRACELGAFAFGKYNTQTGEKVFPEFNYVRFAIPRRAYALATLATTADAVKELFLLRHEIPRAVPVYGRDLPLRHFKARFALQSIS